MGQDERDDILWSAAFLREWENTPRTPDNPYRDMNPNEVVQLLLRQQEMLSEKEALNRDLLAKVNELTTLLQESSERSEREKAALMRTIEELTRRISEMTRSYEEMSRSYEEMSKSNEELSKTVGALRQQLAHGNSERFGSKSQKGSKKRTEAKRRDQDKDDFDGTPGSVSPESTVDAPAEADAKKPKERTPAQSLADKLRNGMKYNHMTADKTVTHPSDLSKLPAGAKLVKVDSCNAYEQKTILLRHEYELVTYKLDGRLYTAYLPADGEPEYIDRVPGTKASAGFLAYLSFNHYVLDTPLYREIDRLTDEGMTISRKTLTNWLYKGSELLRPVVDELKKTALEKDAVINCDETWCRVKTYDRYRKRYIWCLVNREAKTVIYCYEKNGARSREALLEIIGGSQICALQTDGYNVYLYLDNGMEEVVHICCLAHARAKFYYAATTGDDQYARYILDAIAELYKREEAYAEAGLSPEEIGRARRSAESLEIIGRIRSMVNMLTAPDHPPRGELMEKAVRYIDNFWPQIFRYIDNGRYSIDNNVAERNIRPLAGERKNSLFFGSDRMAKASAIFHTVIATCRMKGISVLNYLQAFFQKIVNGEADYSRLMPDTIGLPIKNA